MNKVINEIFNDKDYKEILFKSSSFLIFRLLGFLIAYVFSFYIIDKYGEKTYGFVALSLTVFSILIVFGKIGFDIHLTKIFSAYKNVNIGFSYYFLSLVIAFAFSLLFSGLMYTFASNISNLIFRKPEFTEYLEWTILSVPFWVVVFINSGVLRGLKKNGIFSFIIFFSRFFLTLIILILCASFIVDGTYKIMEYHFYASLIISVFSTLFVLKYKDGKTYFKNIANVKNYIRETIPLMSSTYFYVLLLWSDKIILGIFESEINVGVYDIVTKIAIVITFAYEAINSILAPKISNSFHNKDMALLQRNVRFCVRITFYSGILIFALILLLYRTVLEFLGEVYLTGVYALLILSLGKIIISLFGPVSDILQMTGYQKTYSRIMFVTLLVNLVLNVILIKYFGIDGAAIATSISFILMFLISHLYIRNKLKINSFIV